MDEPQEKSQYSWPTWFKIDEAIQKLEKQPRGRLDHAKVLRKVMNNLGWKYVNNTANWEYDGTVNWNMTRGILRGEV